MALRFEAGLVGREIIAEILAVEWFLNLIGVEIAVVLAERAIEKCLVDGLDDAVQALELVVDVATGRMIREAPAGPSS